MKHNRNKSSHCVITMEHVCWQTQGKTTLAMFLSELRKAMFLSELQNKDVSKHIILSNDYTTVQHICMFVY